MSTVGFAVGVSFGCGVLALSQSLRMTLRRVRMQWTRLVENDAQLAARVSLATGTSVSALIGSAIFGVTPFISVAFALIVAVVALVVQSQQWKAAKDRSRFRIALATPAWLDVLSLCLVAGLPLSVAMGQTRNHSSVELANSWRPLDENVELPLAGAIARVYSQADDPATKRVASSLLIALERGTPVADVLADLSSEIRSENRRLLLEIAAKKDVTMMLPVVFGILPAVTVVALYPALQTLTSLR